MVQLPQGARTAWPEGLQTLSNHSGLPITPTQAHGGAMNRSRHAILTGLAILASGIEAPAAFAASPQNQWPQTHLDVPADPAVLFGRLPNGMRYAIMRNETPTDAVSIRLRIGSGSMVEQDNERGVAHFLEHMAFRGSANFPDGELVKSLQRLGLKFGADTNAFTSELQTVFTFVGI